MSNLYEEFKDLSKRKINEAFITACQVGELEKIKYLLTSSELKENANFKYKQNLAFKVAFGQQHIDILQYFLASPEMRKSINVRRYSLGLLMASCDKKDTPLLEHILPIAIKTYTNAMTILIDKCCNDGNLKIFKYLSESPTWSEKIAVEINSSRFQYVCGSGNLEFIDYLLNCKSKDSIDINADNDQAFINCCESKELEAIKYFIFKLKIPKTSYIEEYFNENPNNFNHNIDRIFNARDLTTSLENELDSHDTKTKRNKL